MQTLAYDIESYLSIRAVSGVTFSPSEDVIAVLTNIAGTSQVWRIDGPGQQPHQLTFGDNRVLGVTWSPTEELLVFSKDEGGNEREQLFLLSPDGSMIEPLTDFPEAIHTFGGWSHDGQRIAFSPEPA